MSLLGRSGYRARQPSFLSLLLPVDSSPRLTAEAVCCTRQDVYQPGSLDDCVEQSSHLQFAPPTHKHTLPVVHYIQGCKLKWLVIEFGDLFVIAARITQTNAGTKRSFVSDVRAHHFCSTEQS